MRSAAVCLAIGCLALTACGDEELRGAGAGGPGDVNEGATIEPQIQQPDAQVLRGRFEPLEADPGQDAAGTVSISPGTDRTRGALSVRNLDPATAIIGEIRSKPCSAGNFRFQPTEGGDRTLEFQFVVGNGGAGTDETTTQGPLPGDARSVVLFPQAGDGEGRGAPGLACADLS